MTPQDRERLDVISDALAQMVRRQREMESRLSRIEALLSNASRREEPAPEPAPEPVAQTPPPAAPQPQPPLLPETLPPVPVPPPRSLSMEPRGPSGQGLESAFGLTWISRIGALTLVIGIAFFFKYAFENHWVTETGRVLLGIGSAAVLLIAGERLWQTMQRTYAQALTATGIAFLYLSFWAEYSLYHLTGQLPDMLLMALTTAGACALAVRYQGGAVATLGLAGGYATPLLLETGHAPWLVLGYTLLLSASAIWLARRWPWLEALALAGATILYLTQGDPIPGERLGFSLWLLALYAVFLCGRVELVVAAAQFLAGVAMAAVVGPRPISFVPRLAIAAGGLAASDMRNWRWIGPAALAGFWLADLDPVRMLPLWATFAGLTAGLTLFLCFPVWRCVRGENLRFSDLGMLALNAALYYAAGYSVLEPAHHQITGLFTLAAAMPHIGIARLLWDRDRRGALLAAGAAWVLLVLAVPIQFTGYRVTGVWALESAALAWIGTRLGERRAHAASLLIFALVVSRLLVIDSAALSAADLTLLWNPRFITAVVCTVSMWAAARWIASGPRSQPWTAAVAYLGGHFCLLWGLCLEVSTWSLQYAAPDSVASVRSLSISILLAGYALALVAIGVARRSIVDRIPGMGLIALVVLKLYLYDVWFLGLFYRMAAFAVLGILLLAISYLYSRYRATIESWWRPE